MGFTTGVNELLLYEESSVIDLLPALPPGWENGEVKNMLVKGVQISFSWKNGEVFEISADKEITVRNSRLADGVRLNSGVHIL